MIPHEGARPGLRSGARAATGAGPHSCRGPLVGAAPGLMRDETGSGSWLCRPARIRAAGLPVGRWPIVDVSVPCTQFEATWQEASGRIRSLLEKGGNVLIHCKGGRGRAGMIAARLLVEMGVNPGEAIANVRAVRDGAVETREQERWVEAGRVCSLPV